MGQNTGIQTFLFIDFLFTSVGLHLFILQERYCSWYLIRFKGKVLKPTLIL